MTGGVLQQVAHQSVEPGRVADDLAARHPRRVDDDRADGTEPGDRDGHGVVEVDRPVPTSRRPLVDAGQQQQVVDEALLAQALGPDHLGQVRDLGPVGVLEGHLGVLAQ